MTDHGGRPVAFDVLVVVDSFEPVVRHGLSCGAAVDVPVPAGADGLVVRVFADVAGACASVGSPTTGTATVGYGAGR